jgi:peptidoglycan/xylan/chitin deacetylase (PgdA/CDA1 family)
MDRGYSVVLWSIDTRDWAGTSALDICKEIYNNVEDGSIILMHDYVCGESHTAEALRIVIPELKKLGYRFVTVSELIGN